MRFKYFIISTFLLVLVSLIAPVSAFAQAEETELYTIEYRAHVEDIGWQEVVFSPEIAGTTNQGLALEAIELFSDNNENLNIVVEAHVQDIGWMEPIVEGLAGTVGQDKNLEAVNIYLTGEDAKNYDVRYQAYVINIGWMNWVSNGETAGTTGQNLPIEALTIEIVEKPATDDASGFVVLSEVVPDIIQEVRYYSTYNFVGDRIDGYEEPTILMTKEAALALKEANEDLQEQGLMLKVYDAYRPQMAVDHFVRWAQDIGDQRMKEYFYPEVDKTILFDEGYIAEKSGHTRGSTVDLTIFDMSTGKELDMGGTFDYFGEKSHPDYVGDLTPEQIANRNLLREVMMNNGFRPLSTEWWHFTLIDEPYPDTYFTFEVSEDVINS